MMTHSLIFLRLSRTVWMSPPPIWGCQAHPRPVADVCRAVSTDRGARALRLAHALVAQDMVTRYAIKVILVQRIWPRAVFRSLKELRPCYTAPCLGMGVRGYGDEVCYQSHTGATHLAARSIPVVEGAAPLLYCPLLGHGCARVRWPNA